MYPDTQHQIGIYKVFMHVDGVCRAVLRMEIYLGVSAALAA